MARSIYLDMSYHSMWSLLDSVPTDALEAEVDRLTEKRSEITSKINELNSDSQIMSSKLNTLRETILARKRKELRETILARKRKELRDNFALKPVHFRLLRELNWRGPNPYGSLSDVDVARILEWELPNDDLSHAQAETASRLLMELPFAIEVIIARETES